MSMSITVAHTRQTYTHKSFVKNSIFELRKHTLKRVKIAETQFRKFHLKLIFYLPLIRKNKNKLQCLKVWEPLLYSTEMGFRLFQCLSQIARSIKKHGKTT